MQRGGFKNRCVIYKSPGILILMLEDFKAHKHEIPSGIPEVVSVGVSLSLPSQEGSVQNMT